MISGKFQENFLSGSNGGITEVQTGFKGFQRALGDFGAAPWGSGVFLPLPWIFSETLLEPEYSYIFQIPLKFLEAPWNHMELSKHSWNFVYSEGPLFTSSRQFFASTNLEIRGTKLAVNVT